MRNIFHAVVVVLLLVVMFYSLPVEGALITLSKDGLSVSMFKAGTLTESSDVILKRPIENKQFEYDGV